MFVKCSSCLGKKENMSLGMMMKKCIQCNGTGFEEEPEEFVSEPLIATPIKKRGRKPKLFYQENKYDEL